MALSQRAQISVELILVLVVVVATAAFIASKIFSTSNDASSKLEKKVDVLFSRVKDLKD